MGGALEEFLRSRGLSRVSSRRSVRWRTPRDFDAGKVWKGGDHVEIDRTWLTASKRARVPSQACSGASSRRRL
jgi:hypothetical protein